MKTKTTWAHVSDARERKRIIKIIMSSEPVEVDDSHSMNVKEIYEIDGERYAWIYFTDMEYYPDENCNDIFVEYIEVHKPYISKDIYPEY